MSYQSFYLEATLQACFRRLFRNLLRESFLLQKEMLTEASKNFSDSPISWVSGVLLVCAAFLKALQLVIQPAVTIITLWDQFALLIAIAVELTVGLFLLVARMVCAVHWCAVLLFIGFAGYSFYLASNGAMSCNCFGPVHIHPWWAFCLDSVVVVGLVLAGPRASSFSRNRLISTLATLNNGVPS